MAYIYLEELEKILPGILDQWIDEDDESWEWIFQEIEQKCHISKRLTAAHKCGSCKHLSKQPIDQPCIGCCYNGMNISGMDKWEAKENE